MNKNVEQQKNAETADNVLAIVWYVFKQLKNMLKQQNNVYKKY